MAVYADPHAAAIRLRLLGGLDLRGPDGAELRTLLAQPKRVALLAYLALAKPGMRHRRDTVLATFWPELDDGHARGALSQALTYLRQTLGADALVTRGADEVGVNPDWIWCDAVAMQEHLAAHAEAEAVALYRGELLDGLFLSDAPQFENWLDSERRRLRELARGAASRLAERSEAAGDVADALRWARHARTLAPLDEVVLRQTIALLDYAGDRAGAMREYESFAALLRNELDVDVSPETRAAVEAIRARVFAKGVPGVSVGPIARPASSDKTETSQALPLRAALAGTLLLTATALWYVRSRPARDPTTIDPRVVAVMPFRISGADPSLAYLREGMIDLLGAKLGGVSGVRAVDSRTLLSAWRRSARRAGDTADVARNAALAMAQSLGAGRVLLGEVVGTHAHVVLTATLIDAASDSMRRAITEGPVDSLTTMVDRLVVQLIAVEVRRGETGVMVLMSESAPAVRAYLEGRALYRRGNYRSALKHFEQALADDSMFALAALGVADAGGWVDIAAQARGFARAFALRERLSPVDRAQLLALVGTRYPLQQTGVEHIRGARALVLMSPDRPEAWYRLGDALFHSGGYVGERDSDAQATHAFEMAILLDSAFPDAIHHLVDLEAPRGNEANVRRLTRLYMTLDSVGETAQYLRWRLAATQHDRATLDAFWRGVDTVPGPTLAWVIGAIQREHVQLEMLPRALAALEARGAWWGRAVVALNRGRPREATSLLALRPVRTGDRYPLERIEVFNALFWDGDSARGALAAAALAKLTERSPTRSAGRRERELHFTAVCVAARWNARHGRLRTVDDAIARLRSAGSTADAGDVVESARLCALELEAELAMRRRRANARELVVALDSAYRQGPQYDRWTNGGNLTVARLLEATGDRVGALAAVRRRSPRDIAAQMTLSTFLREEGRLAVLTGDRASAIRAYRHYLGLRTDPEGSVRPQVDSVHAELARLLAHPQ